MCQASEWMCEQKVFNIFPEDYGARLHLVETVLGLEEAEKFFKSIPENMRDYSVYDILWRSYTRSEKTLDKADATFEKMRDLGFLLKPSPFHLMISLYGQLKKQDMVEKLQRELMENNVEIDSLTKNNVLSTSGKIKAMDKVDEKLQRELMEIDSLMKNNVFSSGEIKAMDMVDVNITNLERDRIGAWEKSYLKDGSIEKAIEMYGGVAGIQRQVYRLWVEHKKEGNMNNDVFRSMISSLLRLDDVQGAEKIYGEWKPDVPEFDMSIPDLLISRFRAEGKEWKVEEMVKFIRKKRTGMHLRMFIGCLAVLGMIIGMLAIIVVTIIWLPPWLQMTICVSLTIKLIRHPPKHCAGCCTCFFI